MELMSDRAYMMKPPQKSQFYEVWGASGLVNTFMNQEVPNPMGTEAPALKTLPDLTLHTFHLAVLLSLYHILHYIINW